MADCQEKDPAKCELYIVEGDSAGGSAKQGRNRQNQAVLPLKGKILNVEKARYDKMLANNEIKMLVQAIGTNIGKENFNIEKLRYHKIIIMTDADVDGAHIRTLILTLLYRHFSILIERGYVYIAKPPLYKFKKGRKEIYLEDEKELENFLIDSVIEDTEIKISGEKFEKGEIKKIIDKYTGYTATLQSYDAHFDFVLLKHIVENSRINGEIMADREKLMREIRPLEEYFKSQETRTLKKYSFSLEEDQGGKNFVKIEVSTSMKAKRFKLNSYFLESAEFCNLVNKYQGIKRYLLSNFSVKRDKEKKEENFNSLKDFSDFILKIGKQGAYIQRYKGLGEMNPEQLWETTMDPKNRNLLKVQIEDMIERPIQSSLFSWVTMLNQGDSLWKKMLSV